MPYRLLIFDFDGTLADSFPVLLERLPQIIDQFRLRRIEAQDLDALRTCGAREVLARLGIPAWKVPLVVRYSRRLLAADAPRIRLFPGVTDILPRLAANECKVAIVSSNAEANIRAVLGPELSARFSVFACGASIFGKAAKFRRVLRHTGVPAHQALAIGDELRDLEAAREARIDFGAVSWGYTRVEAFRDHSPAFLFHRPEDILGVLGSHCGDLSPGSRDGH